MRICISLPSHTLVCTEPPPFERFFHSTTAGLAIPANFDGQAAVLRGIQLKTGLKQKHILKFGIK
jgi:hypothetical protein